MSPQRPDLKRQHLRRKSFSTISEVAVLRASSSRKRGTPIKDAPTLQCFNHYRFSLTSPCLFCTLERMRLLVEVLIIAAVIYFGWNKPFKEYAFKAKTTITSKLDGLGGTLQKHQDSSVKRY